MNQMRQEGLVNTVILAVLVAGGIAAVPIAFVVAFSIGFFMLPSAPVKVIMYVWDGVVVGFLAAWLTGVMISLQRSEVLSLDKFLHLPVSPAGAFVLNYASSLLGGSTLVFGPFMLGLSLGLTFGIGPAMLVQLPLAAAFVLMTSALTYHFQGWLATLMVDQRRWRNLVVIASLVAATLGVLPGFMALTSLPRTKFPTELTEEQKEERRKKVEETVRIVNLMAPPGWLPLGAMAAAEDNLLPGLIGTLAMTLIGMPAFTVPTAQRSGTTPASLPAHPIRVPLATHARIWPTNWLH